MNLNMNATLDVVVDGWEFLALVLDVINALPKGHAELADQLLRAAQSQPRNIAEGAGRRTTVDQARFYTHARGSAME